MADDKIATLVGLSHAFGTAEYVLGGGGNTSCKDEATLWVKPSGTVLGEMTAESFVALDRAKLASLYALEAPGDPSAREALVKETAGAAVQAGSAGRPSVEAPLHDSFDAAFVVHTHPTRVNGLTCAQHGAQTCAELFPDALWVPYTDPGYTLCMRVRADMARYADAHGCQPRMVFLQNHGVFVAGDTADSIRADYARILETLDQAFAAARVDAELPPAPPPEPAVWKAVAETLRTACGEAAQSIAPSGRFSVAEGPLSPDHIVYAKAHPFVGEPTAAALQAFEAERGYPPRVLSAGAGVFGVGASQQQADLALRFAKDGARVCRFAEAFGGVRFLDKRASDFIEHWEVESYRRKVASGG